MTGKPCFQIAPKDYIRICLYVSWLSNVSLFGTIPYVVVEFFAGVARIARLANWCRFKSAAVDIEYDDSKTGSRSVTTFVI